MQKILMMPFQYRKTKKDLYEIGVHIADVSHFVEEETELDKEATNVQHLFICLTG